MELKSMKMDPSQMRDYAMPVQGSGDLPLYPYGLCLNLEDEQIKALGLAAMPEAGQTLMIMARVQVSSVSERSTQGQGKDRSLGLQITDLAVGPDTSKPSATDVLYKS